MSITASEARRTRFPLIERINADRVAVELVSRKGNAVLMPADEYAAWQETAYLFRSPANARRLLDAYERARAGAGEEHELGRFRESSRRRFARSARGSGGVVSCGRFRPATLRAQPTLPPI